MDTPIFPEFNRAVQQHELIVKQRTDEALEQIRTLLIYAEKAGLVIEGDFVDMCHALGLIPLDDDGFPDVEGIRQALSSKVDPPLRYHSGDEPTL
tara:strand:- start:236 stop:520 length:285 start_codon:yes stop_codon:yes gene_type:complete